MGARGKIHVMYFPVERPEGAALKRAADQAVDVRQGTATRLSAELRDAQAKASATTAVLANARAATAKLAAEVADLKAKLRAGMRDESVASQVLDTHTICSTSILCVGVRNISLECII